MKNTLFVLLALTAASAVQEASAQTFLPDFGNLDQPLETIRWQSDMLAYKADMDAAWRAQYSRNDPSKAESRYTSAVERANRLRSMDHWCAAVSGLASLALDQKDYAKAEGLYIRYLYYGKDIPIKIPLAHGYLGLAEARAGLGQLASAEDYFQKAIELTKEETVESGAAITRAHAVEGLATVYARQWRYKLAEATLREAIEAYGKNAAEAMDKLASLLLVQGRLAEASAIQAEADVLRTSAKARDAQARQLMREAYPELF